MHLGTSNLDFLLQPELAYQTEPDPRPPEERYLTPMLFHTQPPSYDTTSDFLSDTSGRLLALHSHPTAAQEAATIWSAAVEYPLLFTPPYTPITASTPGGDTALQAHLTPGHTNVELAMQFDTLSDSFRPYETTTLSPPHLSRYASQHNTQMSTYSRSNTPSNSRKRQRSEGSSTDGHTRVSPDSWSTANDVVFWGRAEQVGKILADSTMGLQLSRHLVTVFFQAVHTSFPVSHSRGA
jgi:hypothetical protein